MERIIESLDYKIYTKVEGQGKPVLMLHSLWGESSLYNEVAGILSSKFRIIRIDFPGHGNSPSPDKNFSFREFAAVIHDILHQLEINGKIAIMGHSMGGFSGLAFAKKYPEKTACLVLMHSLIREADRESIKLRERQARLISLDKKELLLQATFASNFAPGNADIFAKEFDQLTESAYRVSKKGALAGIHAINSRESSLEFMKMAKIPALIVIGGKDQVYNPEDQLYEYSYLPHTNLLMLQNSGHLGFIEEKDVFVHKILAFLDCVKIQNWHDFQAIPSLERI
jgi:pimeloyl-ACP methyl ester carboxylesterase